MRAPAQDAYGNWLIYRNMLDVGGDYAIASVAKTTPGR